MPQLFRAGGQVRGDKGAEPDAMAPRAQEAGMQNCIYRLIIAEKQT